MYGSFKILPFCEIAAFKSRTSLTFFTERIAEVMIMAREKRSLNLIFLFSLVRSPRGTSLEASRCRKITVRSLPASLASTCNRRIVNSTVDSQDARKTHFVRAGLIHSESTQGAATTGCEYRELHFQLKTRLPFRSSTRSTPLANVLLIYARFLPA